MMVADMRVHLALVVPFSTSMYSWFGVYADKSRVALSALSFGYPPAAASPAHTPLGPPNPWSHAPSTSPL